MYDKEKDGNSDDVIAQRDSPDRIGEVMAIVTGIDLVDNGLYMLENILIQLIQKNFTGSGNVGKRCCHILIEQMMHEKLRDIFETHNYSTILC